MAISTARQFFDQLVTGDTPSIEALVPNSMHETEWLDFKSGDPLVDEKSTWSEAICGFANNQGGVLIWGIDARKDPATQIDAARELKPVQNPAALRSRLLELLRGAVEPPVPGVEVREFFQSGAAAPGYVVCYIPESDTKPHRAELLSNKPYKIRIADAFINPSPSLLRSLFFPKSSPLLEVDIAADWPSEGSEPVRDIEAKFTVILRNVGIVSAKDIFLAISTVPIGLKAYGANAETRLSDEESRIGVDYPRPLHPSSSEKLCVIRHPVPTSYQYDNESPKVKFFPRMEPCEILIDVFAADMIPVKLGVAFGDRDVVERRRKKALRRPTE